MSYEIEADHSQKFLFPPSLDDLLPVDHPARFIKEFVESMDLKSLGFTHRTAKSGRPNYSSDLLLKAWLYGYQERIYSSRGLEKACRNLLPMIWLTGLNYPDHNTLWRFFQQNKHLMTKVFRHTLSFAIRNDMVDFALQAIDGTKIYANASREKTISKKDIEKLLSLLGPSSEEIHMVVESTESGIKESLSKLPKELQNKQHLKSLIKKDSEQLSVSLKKPLAKLLDNFEEEDANYIVATDTESRLMRAGGYKAPGYNAQIAVEPSNQIITGSCVSNNSNDANLLNSVIEEAEDSTGKKCAKTVVDKGYYNGKELLEAESQKRDVVVNVPSYVGKSTNKPAEFSKDKFKYDKESDIYICPAGRELRLRQERSDKKGLIYMSKSCEDCPHLDLCIGSSKSKKRTITRAYNEHKCKEYKEKSETVENKSILKKRKAIVEPVFGWIKHNRNFRRWSYRGLESVNAQWNLICSSVNLATIFGKLGKKAI